MNTDYVALKKEIEEMLTGLGVSWEVRLIGDACPRWCEDKAKGLPGIGTFPRRTHIHGRQYQLTMRRAVGTETHPKNAVVVVDYWNSYLDAAIQVCNSLVNLRGVDNDRLIKSLGYDPYKAESMRRLRVEQKENRLPSVADVLGCCEFHECSSFEDFADEFGYDRDSRKAEDVWRAVQGQVRDLRRMFVESELAGIEEKVREL